MLAFLASEANPVKLELTSDYFFGGVLGEFPFFSALLYRNVVRDFKA